MRMNAIVGLTQNFNIYIMKAEIIYQEAYVYMLNLQIEFKYMGKNYVAHADYINGCGIENIEVNLEDDYIELVSDEVVEVAENLLDEMHLENNLTF